MNKGDRKFVIIAITILIFILMMVEMNDLAKFISIGLLLVVGVIVEATKTRSQ